MLGAASRGFRCPRWLSGQHSSGGSLGDENQSEFSLLRWPDFEMDLLVPVPGETMFAKGIELEVWPFLFDSWYENWVSEVISKD